MEKKKDTTHNPVVVECVYVEEKGQTSNNQNVKCWEWEKHNDGEDRPI